MAPIRHRKLETSPQRARKLEATLPLDLNRRALTDEQVRRLGQLLEEYKLRVVRHRDVKTNGINVDIVTMKDDNEQRVVAYFHRDRMGKVTKIC
jgi:phage gp16-like protein